VEENNNCIILTTTYNGFTKSHLTIKRIFSPPPPKDLGFAKYKHAKYLHGQCV
jgi:hypothetical protein